MLTKSLGVQSQVVPVNVHPALMAMGMETTILSRPLQLAGMLQHFLSNWQLLTRDQFILEMVVGIQIPFTIFPHQSRVPPTHTSQPVRKDCHRSGDFGDAPERGNSGGLSYEWGISQFSFPSQEERWGKQTCNQLERVEFLCNIPALQNGGSVFTETFYSDWRLDDKNRFERCLLYCASKQTTSTPFAFHLQGPEIPIFLSPLWVRARPLPFYKALKACCCPIKETGSETSYLSRRHYCFQSDSGGYLEGQGLNTLATPAFRLCDQLEEVSFTSCPVHGIPRFCHQLHRDEAFLPPGKMTQLVQDCKDLILEKSASMRTLSHIIGKLTSTMQAVLPAPLH